MYFGCRCIVSPWYLMAPLLISLAYAYPSKYMKNYEQVSGKRVVMVADDDNDLLQLMKMQLQQAGFSVQLSPNGLGIIRMAANDHPDIILLDIAMDGISGADICKKLKADVRTSDIPIIMFSANENIEQIVNTCGANDFVRKPFDAQVMKEKIMHYIH